MPRTLAQNAQYIAETIKPAIKSAIEAQGVTVPSTDSFLDYADRIGEIEGGGSGYQLKDLPTGSIATVNDAAELPLNALKVSVEAVQDLHGYDHPWVGGAGKNKIDASDATLSGDGYFINKVIDRLPSGDYVLSFDCTVSENALCQFDIKDVRTVVGTKTVSINSGTSRVTMKITASSSFNVAVAYITKASTIRNIQLEQGSSFTSFEPYSNICPIEGWDSGEITVCDDVQNPTQTETYTQQFPQTIYGAEWDVVGGDLKQTDGYIASYNGESLPSSWISDRDVYASGTTPTTGAEVVYKLATPTTIDLSPLSIRLLEGTNNVYADCGEVIEGEYFSGDNQLYANGIIFAGKGDSGIGSYRKIDTLPTDLLNATAMTCEVCARFDSFVNLSSGPYARIITLGDDNQTGRFGVIGVAYDGSSSYDLCVWDDTIDLSSGLYVWTPTDTHTVAVVKTTAGAIKIYVDGVLKYTGSSALTITNTLIDYICQRSRYNASYDTQRQINGEVYAWRIYGKELSASQINANFLVDKINYID